MRLSTRWWSSSGTPDQPGLSRTPLPGPAGLHTHPKDIHDYRERPARAHPVGHAIVILLPLAALLLVLCAVWPAARRRLAGPNAILSVIVLALVPVTTDAGDWLEHRVASNPLVRAHTDLGDTALYVAIPVAVLALLIWWRGKEVALSAQPGADRDGDKVTPSGDTMTAVRTAPRRTFLAPASSAVTAVVAVLAVLAAGAAAYDIYRIGASGAQAAWQGQFSSTPIPRPHPGPSN